MLAARPSRASSLAVRAKRLTLAGALLLVGCTTTAAPAPTPAPATKPAVGASTATGGAAPATAAAPARVDRIRLGTLSPSSSDAGWLIALDRGYFTEQGVELETTPFNTAAEMVPPLGAGQLDAGGGAPSAGLFNAVARGINLRIVADKGGTQRGFGYTALLVRRELSDSGAVRGPADLRGRKVALPNLGGISPEAALDRLLQAHGLSTRDVDLTLVPFPDQPAAYAGGSVDAGMLIEPFVTLSLEQGTTTILARQDDWYPDQQVATIMFAEAFASQQADVGRRFVAAYLKGVREYNDAFARRDETKRREVIDVLVKHTALKDRALWERVAVPSLDPNGQVNKVALESDQQYYLRTGKQQDHADLDKIVDTSFVDAAVQLLGRYQ